MIGQTLQNRYRLESELGRGGMGIVYRAHDTLLNRAIAVKLLSNAGLGTAGKVRLLAEARAAAKLNHPNIVAVHDAGEVEDNPFIVMELVAGDSLRHFQPASLDDTLNLTRQICLALEHAHANGIIHRDLKPDNIILTADRTAKLMDFGLARTADTPQLTEEGTLMGTFGYMAPELVQGQAATVQSDLYALGVMLYEWLAGRPPFSGENLMALMMQHLHAPVVPSSQHQPDVPASLDMLVLQLLSKEPEGRPTSATAVREVIDSLSSATSKGSIAFFSSALQQTRHNLPRQLTSFVGREKEIGHLQRQLLNPANRLVTLTGPGGTGKTRLSLEVAGTLLDAFADGIWLVELAPLADPALVVSAVATVFELREEGGRPLAAILADYLQNKQLLLILDNCEHLVEMCARLAESWLEDSPRLAILASSREALGVPGEVIVRVSPLAVPDVQQAMPLAALAEVEAVQLFVERTRLALPDFGLTERNSTAVIQICQRLDGIPLALELAAARVKVLQVEQIAQRLDDRFRLLTGGSRTALPRQRTLQATIDWSYDLLPEAEQRLLQRLSVFAGGWTLEAAEAVCADEHINQYEILDLLTQLVNKSLVLAEREPGRESRYRLLETIRQYAQEKLLQAGNGETFRRPHLGYFMQLAETAEPLLFSAAQLVWEDRLEAENENLQSALTWSLEKGDENLEPGLRLATALVAFWTLQARYQEGRRWLDLALAKRHSVSLSLQARLLLNTSELWTFEEEKDPTALLKESLALYRQLQDRRGIAWSLCWLGINATFQREPDKAAALFSESLKLAQELGDKPLLIRVYVILTFLAFMMGDFEQVAEQSPKALALLQEMGDRFWKQILLAALGMSASYQGDYVQARIFFVEALALARELKDKGHQCRILTNWGEAARVQRAYEEATIFYQESLTLAREVNGPQGGALLLHNLGLVALGQGDKAQARLFFGESMALEQKGERKAQVLENIWGLAQVALAEDQPRRAAQLFAAARVEKWRMLHQIDQNDYERDVALARTQLGEEAFAAAWAAGQAMSLAEAITYALEE